MHTIDHLGIAVKSLAQARKFYEQLGLEVLSEETVPHEKVKVAMIPLGQSRIELLEATSPDSVISKFVEKRGEGLHHVAVHVPGSHAGRGESQEDGHALCFGRNQDRRRRPSLCFRASLQHRRRAAGTCAGCAGRRLASSLSRNGPLQQGIHQLT